MLHKVETLHHNDVWRGIVHPSFNLALYPYDQRDNLARMNIILMLVFLVKLISIPDEELFSETYVGCTALYFV